MKEKCFNILIFFVLLLLNYILSTEGLIKYILSFIILIVLALKSRVEIRNKFCFFAPNITYIVIGLIFCILNGFYSLYYLKFILLLLLPFILSILLYSIFKNNLNRIINIQLYALLFLYIVIERMPGESQYSFTFGMLIIYLLYNNSLSKKKKIILSSTILLLLLVFTGKRLATILTILIIFLAFAFKNFKLVNKKQCTTILILLSAFSMLYIYGCSHGLYDYLVSHFGVLVSGREYLYNLFSPYYSFDWKYLGKGIGWTYEKISLLNIKGAGNLHNDLLMTYIDLGFFGYIIWIFSFNKWFKNVKNTKSYIPILIIIIYTVGNYMTDNIMIYVNYWLTTYLLLFSYSVSDDV